MVLLKHSWPKLYHYNDYFLLFSVTRYVRGRSRDHGAFINCVNHFDLCLQPRNGLWIFVNRINIFHCETPEMVRWHREPMWVEEWIRDLKIGLKIERVKVCMCVCVRQRVSERSRMKSESVCERSRMKSENVCERSRMKSESVCVWEIERKRVSERERIDTWCRGKGGGGGHETK